MRRRRITGSIIRNSTRLLDKKGQVLTFMGSGGFFAPCGNSQSAIYGALVSASPVSGADAIVSNQFAVQQHVSGPYTIFSSPSLMGNTVFGTSAEYYDAPHRHLFGGRGVQDHTLDPC